MREVYITIEAPPDVRIRVIRKEAPSRLRLSPRGKVGKPVASFLAAVTASSKDGATAPADAVRDAFNATYPATGKNNREAIERAWRRALALVEDAFEVAHEGGVEIFRRIEKPQSPTSPTGKAPPTAPVDLRGAGRSRAPLGMTG